MYARAPRGRPIIGQQEEAQEERSSRTAGQAYGMLMIYGKHGNPCF